MNKNTKLIEHEDKWRWHNIWKLEDGRYIAGSTHPDSNPPMQAFTIIHGPYSSAFAAYRKCLTYSKSRLIRTKR